MLDYRESTDEREFAWANALPVNSKAFANALLLKAWREGKVISPLKIQKLLYFCHAEFLISVGRPLIIQQFEAWDHGPVDPSLYREFKEFGSKPIIRLANSLDPIRRTFVTQVFKGDSLPSVELDVLRASYDRYSDLSAEELSEISHAEKGPWMQARSLYSNGLGIGRRITDKMIVESGRV